MDIEISKSISKSSSASDRWGDDDDLFGADTSTNVPNQRAAPKAGPSRQSGSSRIGGHVSVGSSRPIGSRGVSGQNPNRKPAPMKLGAKKITAADLDLESMLNQ